MKELQQTVYIIDDDEAVRDSLSLLLDTIGLHARAFASGMEFLEQYETLCAPEKSGCLLLDIRMPGMSGTEVHQQLIERECTFPIIFITGHGDIPMAVQAIQRGALDFIAKPFRDQELIDRIQQALRLHAEHFEARLEQQAIQARLDTLTAREREVMNLMIDGKANKVIAAELHLSQRTIEVHRAHVLDKMAASSLLKLAQALSRLTAKT